jgi:hypothetical protein
MKRYRFLILFIIILTASHCRAQKIVISNTLQNVLYTGIVNPVEIAVSNNPCDSIYVEMEHGEIKGKDCTYRIKVDKEGDNEINVYRISGMDTLGLESIPVLVKPLPKPVMKICGKSGNDINPAVFRVQKGICAELENFPLPLKYEIISHKVLFIKSNGKLLKFKGAGPYFSAEMQADMLEIFPDDIVLFYDVICKIPDGSEILLAPVIYYMRSTSKD